MTDCNDLPALQAFVDAAPCGLIELAWEPANHDFRIIRANSVAKELISPLTKQSDILGTLLAATIPGHTIPQPEDDGLSLLEVYRRITFREYPYEAGERRTTLKFFSIAENRERHYQQSVLNFADSRISIGFLEITEKVHLIERLRQQTIQDDRTGLFTRNYIYNAINAAAAQCDRGECYWFIRIDLDDFKNINETAGHQGGDQAIVWMARQIKNCTREGDTVARMGGDEFAILGRGDIDTAKRVAERIRISLNTPFKANGVTQIKSASLGITAITHGMDSNTVDSQADAAQRQAKKSGKNKVIVWGDFEDLAEKRYRLEQQLLNAIQRQEFILHFQPIVKTVQCFNGSRLINPVDIEPAGYEALVRWEHQGQIIGPGEFIELLESGGNLFPLTAQIMRMAGAAQRQIEALQLDRFISVNLAASDLADPRFREISFHIEGPGFHPEITEREKLDCIGIAEVERLKKLGCKISLDDFGAGWSNLANLACGVYGILKLDKSLVDILGTDNGDKICRASILMAHTLGLKIIAEGVEADEQVRKLHEMGCDYIQGYWHSEPGPLVLP